MVVPVGCRMVEFNFLECKFDALEQLKKSMATISTKILKTSMKKSGTSDRVGMAYDQSTWPALKKLMSGKQLYNCNNGFCEPINSLPALPDSVTTLPGFEQSFTPLLGGVDYNDQNKNFIFFIVGGVVVVIIIIIGVILFVKCHRRRGQYTPYRLSHHLTSLKELSDDSDEDEEIFGDSRVEPRSRDSSQTRPKHIVTPKKKRTEIKYLPTSNSEHRERANPSQKKCQTFILVERTPDQEGERNRKAVVAQPTTASNGDPTISPLNLATECNKSLNLITSTPARGNVSSHHEPSVSPLQNDSNATTVDPTLGNDSSGTRIMNSSEFSSFEENE